MSATAPTEGKGQKRPRTPMPEQEPAVRARNFEEVSLGYTPEMAQAEASRCLRCKKPGCVVGCPVGIDIPRFIGALSRGDIADAYATIRLSNSLPAVCGRVCPQENQCEKGCILGKKGEPVAIGRLERFVADTFMDVGSEFDAVVREPSGTIRKVTPEELDGPCNRDSLDPKDGPLLKVCDSLAAFIEAYTALRNGITSDQLQRAVWRIRTQYAQTVLFNRVHVGALLADFD